MKKILFTLLFAFVLMFSACNYQSNENKDQSTDSLELVDDTIQKEDILVIKDTLHCVAITKEGVQCKNHRVKGDTLCAIHRKQK